jgi:hypothetical protein
MVRKNQDYSGNSVDKATLTVKILDWLSHSAPAKSGYTFGQDVAAQQGYVALPAQAQTVARNVLLSVNFNGTTLLK